MARCTAKTKSTGKRCENQAKRGEKLCGTHGSGKAGAPAKSPSNIYGKIDGEERTFADVICAHVSVGMTRHRTAILMRMAPATIASWLERGEADEQAGLESEFSEFYLRFGAARARFVSNALTRIDKAAKDGDWKAAVQQLKLINREEFGDHVDINHSGSVNLVEQHAEQFVAPLLALLGDLGVADDPRVPDLIEKHFTSLERPAEV